MSWKINIEVKLFQSSFSLFRVFRFSFNLPIYLRWAIMQDMKYPGGRHQSSTFGKLWPVKIDFASVLTDPTYLAVKLGKTKNVLTLFLFLIWPTDELIRYHVYLLIFKIFKCIFKVWSRSKLIYSSIYHHM